MVSTSGVEERKEEGDADEREKDIEQSALNGMQEC